MLLDHKPQFKEIPVAKVVDNPYQPRKKYDKDGIKELANSIRARGLQNPITVMRSAKKYIVISGHRRLRAYRYLRRESIPAFIRERMHKKSLIIDLMIENFMREDFTPLEKAETLRDLLKTIKNVKSIDDCLSIVIKLKLYKKRERLPKFSRDSFGPESIPECERLLKLIGVAENTAYDYLCILRLPEEFRTKITRGSSQSVPYGWLSIKAAYQITRIQDSSMQRFFAKKFMFEHWTFKRLKYTIDDYIQKKSDDSEECKKFYSIKKRNITTNEQKIENFIKSLWKTESRLTWWRHKDLFSLTLMKKNEFIIVLKEIKNRIAEMNKAVDEKLVMMKDMTEQEAGARFDPVDREFEAQVHLSVNKHNMRFTFPSEIHKDSGIKHGDIVKFKVISVKKNKR